MSKSLKKLIDINRLREFKNKLVGTGSAYVQTAAVDQTIAGTKTFSNGVLLTNDNALMAQNGEYTLVLRNDSRDTYLLMSDKGGVPGTWSDARPFVINNSTGVCSINGNAATATTATTAKACTGNAATATTATTAKSCTGNAATATKATQDSDGNKITTTYSKNGHTHDDRYYTEAEVNNLIAAANGVDSQGQNWIRFRNGIQICWAQILCEKSGVSTWTYGASFSSTPVVTVCDQGANTKKVYLTRAADIGTASCLIVMVESNDGRYMPGIAQCIAIGRWK